MNGVPEVRVAGEECQAGVTGIGWLNEPAAVFASKGEMRKLVQSGGVSINKEKLDDQDALITESSLLNSKYILVQRGKKNYYLLIAK